MDLNPYAAPHEPDRVLAPLLPQATPGGRLRKWGVRLGAASLIAFFSIYGLMVVAVGIGLGRGEPPREVIVILGCLVISSGVFGLLSLALIAAGVVVELFSLAFGDAGRSRSQQQAPSPGDSAGNAE